MQSNGRYNLANKSHILHAAMKALRERDPIDPNYKKKNPPINSIVEPSKD